MKEVLFRGKTVDTNEWIQGSLVRAIDCLDDNEKFFIISEDAIYYHYGEFDIVKEVRSETIGQYTGFKDKNGIKIFEDDIVLGMYDDKKFRVVCIGGSCIGRASVISDDDKDGYYIRYCLIDTIKKVVGNIHDNPNLLDEVEEWKNQ